MVVPEGTKSGPAKKGAPLTVEGTGWVVVSEGTKLGPAKKGAPFSVGATGASSSAKTVAKRPVKAMVEYFIASRLLKSWEEVVYIVGTANSKYQPLPLCFRSREAAKKKGQCPLKLKLKLIWAKYS